MKLTTLNKRVAVGLSGGVDSSVAAALLVEQGYEVTGVYITCWSGPGCRSEEDRQDALDIALQLDIPFVHLNYQKEYKEKVYEYMISEYEAGRTPNPDVVCNKEIKFGLFYDWVMKEGYDFVATGHYAQTDGKQLFRSADEHKDQTYFLYQLSQEQLPHILFPIGHLTKKEVRAEAEKRKLLSAKKPDSQGICFIGEVNVSKFLEERIEKKEGDIVLGEMMVGRHKGVWFYTVGQKIAGMDAKRLTRAGFNTTSLPHFYVLKKDIENNILSIGTEDQLYTNKIQLTELHWIDKKPGSNKFLARIRHGGELVESALNDQDQLRLKKPVWGVASGQVAVFYQGNMCFGGGVIK